MPSNMLPTPATGAPQAGQVRVTSMGRQQPGGHWMVNGGGYNGAVGGIDPVDVRNPNPGQLNNYNQFFDQTYGAFTRNLDPQWEANQRRFDQDMVNRGIAQGSEAYTTALNDFNRGRNDAYNSANTAAQQSALAAQNQFWGQNYNEAQLANALAQSQMSANASILGSEIGAGASMYGHDIGRQNFTDNLGFQRERADMTDLMGLYGMGNDMTSYNNNLLNQDYGRGGDFMSMIPGINPQGLNVSGALNQQNQANYNNSMNAYNADQQQQQQYMQLASTMAMMAFMSSRLVKDSLGPLEPIEALQAIKGLEVDRWRYHGDSQIHVGPYAEDFNKATTGVEKPFIGVVDMLGTLTAAVKGIGAMLDKVEARLSALEARHA